MNIIKEKNMKKYYHFTYTVETSDGHGYEGDGWDTGIGELLLKLERLTYNKTGRQVRRANIQPTGESMTEREHQAMLSRAKQ